ncbi:hypothetical protein [Emticicia sp. 17c]|uniref:hypothetical protein n=1 Tax=Emticicia sp. 17c TaxID=3127704 RepID=UPI00301C57CE
MSKLFSFLSKYQKLLLLLGLIPVLFYCYVVLRFSSDVPFYDDFFWGFDYLELYLQKNTFFEKVKMLFMQHNQHRLIYFRSVLLSLFYLEGTLNIKHLILAGNLSIFGVLITYWLVFRRMAISLVYFLPVPFLLLPYQFMFNSIVSYGVPNMSIIFLATLTLYFTCFAAPKNIYLVWIVGFLATFSNGNGIVVLLIATFLLFLQGRTRQAIYTAVIYAASMAVYFSGFHMKSGEATFNANTFLYVFRFLGAAFFTNINTVSVVLSALAILAIVVYFLYFFLKFIQNKYRPINDKVILFCLGIFMFLGCTALMTAIVRAIHKVDIPDWYKNYSILFVVSIYAFLLAANKKQWLQQAFLGVFIIYGAGIWYKSAEKNLPSYQYLKSTFDADVANYHKNKYWSFLTAQEGIHFYERHNQQTAQFISKGWYQLPQSPLLNQKFDESKCLKTNFRIEDFPERFAKIIQYDPVTLDADSRGYKERFGFIINDSTKRIYFFGIVPTFNGIRGIIKYKSLFYDKAEFSVNYNYFGNAIPSGNYRVGMVFIDAQKQAIWRISDQTISVNNFESDNNVNKE